MTLREGDPGLAVVTRKPKSGSLDQALNRILEDLLWARLIDSVEKIRVVGMLYGKIGDYVVSSLSRH